MGRRTAQILLGLAGFLLVFAALAKWYVYPNLAVAPLDQNSVTTLKGTGMQYFDKASLTVKTDDLTTLLNTVGDVDAAKSEGNDVAVWSQGTTTMTSDGTVIAALKQRTAFGRTSGAAVDCCDNNMNGEAVAFSGQIYKWPFNSQKKTYQFFDNDTRQAWPATYAGTATLDGLAVYHYVAEVPPTKIDTLSVPSKVVGAKPGTMVSVEQWESNHEEFFVEPETGVIIKATQDPNAVLRYQGQDAVIATKGHTEYTPKQVQDNVDTYKSKVLPLKIMRVYATPVGIAAGILALLAGLWLVLTNRRSKKEEAPAPVEATASS